MEAPAARRARAVLERALPPALLVVVGLCLFPVSGSDDKYFSYWSAHTLATMGEIVNYNGDRIEQSSSLTQVVLLGALAKVVPLSVPALGWLLSVSSGAATVWITQSLAGAFDRRLVLPAGLVAASSASLVYWSFGGLETPLAAFLGVALVLAGLAVLREGATFGRTARAGVATLLFAGVRPEAAFVALALWLGVLAVPALRRRVEGLPPDACERDRARRAAVLLALVAVSFAALAAFRYAYFGDLFPQPVRAKAGTPDGETVLRGLRYVLVDPWLRLDPWTVLTAALGSAAVLWRKPRGRDELAPSVVALACCAQLGFVTLSGGDWMEGGRFLAPLVPMAAILVAALLRHLPRRGARAGLVGALVAAQLSACVELARRSSFGAPLWAAAPATPASVALETSWFDRQSRVHTHLMPLTVELIRLLESARPPGERPVRVFSGQMGFVPYFVAHRLLGRVHFIDKGGLCTREVGRLPGVARRARTATGMPFRYTDLFRLGAADRTAPDWAPPDVIFDYDLPAGRDSHREARAVAHGYARSFRQTGFPSNGSRLLPGITRWRDAFIVVRPEVFPQGIVPSEFRFGS